MKLRINEFGMVASCVVSITVMALAGPALRDGGPDTQPNEPTDKVHGVQIDGTWDKHKHTWQQPYGGCDEAWQAPHSKGARECRLHGFEVPEVQR